MKNIEPAIKSEFPILKRQIGDGKELVYLDNAATTQKPQVVIDSLVDYYSNHNANIHRGVHTLSEESSQMYEAVRGKAQKFIGARIPREIVFTRSTTESINLVAYAWGEKNIKSGDEIVLTEMEHHANLVPWQRLCEKTGAILRFIPVGDDGLLDFRNIKGIITEKTKLTALIHASNFLGTLNDLSEITKLAKNRGSLVLIDAAQSVPHVPVNVNELRADFLAFSGHKMYGPMGAGILYIRSEVAQDMEPFMTGGGMIKMVTWTEATFQDYPERFEAGTPAVADVVAFGATLDWFSEFEWQSIIEHEKKLTTLLLNKLQELGGLRIFGPQTVDNRIGVVSFRDDLIHSHDLATILDEEGVAVRSGHHCVQPLHRKLGLTDTTRASLGIYNTTDDIDRLIVGIKKARQILL